MTQAKNGDEVQVHYTGKLDDGTIFDSSKGRAPLSFKLGEGKVIPTFEEAVLGMKVGEQKSQDISADKAYGLHMAELVFEVEKEKLPTGLQHEVGASLQIKQDNGSTTPVVIVAVADKTVTLDANHKLAGKDLSFDLELVNIA